MSSSQLLREYHDDKEKQLEYAFCALFMAVREGPNFTAERAAAIEKAAFMHLQKIKRMRMKVPDFATRANCPRTTDDKLDEIMAEQDQAAAQKAAGEFQAMLQQMVKVQEEALRQAESSGQQAVENGKEAKEMIEVMKALMESSGKVLYIT